MTPQQFDTTLAGHARGDRFVYHTGLLMSDRIRKPAVLAIARAAWQAFARGDCALVQRRRADGVCDYLAWKL